MSPVQSGVGNLRDLERVQMVWDQEASIEVGVEAMYLRLRTGVGAVLEVCRSNNGFGPYIKVISQDVDTSCVVYSRKQ